MKKTTTHIIRTTLIASTAGFVVLTVTEWMRLSVPEVSASASSNVISLRGTIRDFKSTHPDFDIVPSGGLGHYAGNVRHTLASDQPAFEAGGIETESGALNDAHLIAYWNFDDGAGTTAADAKEQNDGTLLGGASWTTGDSGGAIRFDGTNDYVEIPSSPEMQVMGDITFAGRFKLDEDFDPASPNTLVFMEKFLDTERDFHLGLAGGDYNRPEVPKGSLVFKVENGPTSDYYRYKWTNRTSWTAGVWYHFAGVLDSSNTANNVILVDGVDDTASTDAGGVGFIDTGYDAPMRIGGKTIDYNGTATDIHFKGVLDEVMILNRIVTEDDFGSGGPVGFKVGQEWREYRGYPIAPHLYTEPDRMLALHGRQGIGLSGSILVTNGGLVDAAPSTPLVVASNGTGANTVHVTKAGSMIDGDVRVAGNPAADVTADSGGTITGTTGALATPVSLPPVTVPDLGPSTGNRTYSSNATLSTDLHVDLLTIDGNSVVTVTAPIAIVCETGLIIENSSQFQIAPGASLDIFILGNTFAIENSSQVNTALADPSLCSVYYLGTADASTGNTIQACMGLYAPNAEFEVTNAAHVWGAFIGQSLLVRNGPAVFTAMGSFGVRVRGMDDACGVAIDDDAGTATMQSTGGITSANSFHQWYADVMGTNLSQSHTIDLLDDGSGVYEYLDDGFHPIDDSLFGNESDPHNYLFTYALRARFTYQACTDQFFEFEGSDDAWLFVDGRLAMDLGGIMPGTEQYVPLDRLNLVDGETYDLHFFYAQRQRSEAAFRLRTNLELVQVQPGVVSGGYD